MGAGRMQRLALSLALLAIAGWCPANAPGGGRAAAEAPPAGGFTLGERPFAAASSWNTPLPASTPLEKLDWPADALFGVAWSSYSPAIHVGAASDPLVLVAYPASWGRAAGRLAIRIPAEADGARGSDGELLVIDGGTVHNFWQFRRLGPEEATAQAYASADLACGDGWGRASPFLGAGITAAGASQLAGLLVQAETDRGEIAHALQIAIDAAYAKPGYTGAAIGGDGRSPAGLVQEGERLAIPAATPMPDGLSPLGGKVFRAYRRYGAFVVDVAGGVTNLRAQANAYDEATIAALRRDLARISPLLRRVKQTVP
ncbi:hypothetical protein [Bosea minatitlanensis]|uniref:Uncharacterized protein n=1 Tax=Bosea minatitlanensis TaxID=128782 RepID=A0ABW0F8V9_9HYPH|nr:hypothetical protein [Bosea minatitlanensis]MCT4495641.1 hypothetical protein [Bosea minatitlanensis]